MRQAEVGSKPRFQEEVSVVGPGEILRCAQDTFCSGYILLRMHSAQDAFARGAASAQRNRGFRFLRSARFDAPGRGELKTPVSRRSVSGRPGRDPSLRSGCILLRMHLPEARLLLKETGVFDSRFSLVSMRQAEVGSKPRFRDARSFLRQDALSTALMVLTGPRRW
jgi:hypothetical protein